MMTFTFLQVLFSLSLFLLNTQAQFATAPTNLTSGFVALPQATRQITWTYSPNGLVVYDGDIIFGTIAEFNEVLMNVTFSPDSSSPSRRNIHPARGIDKRAYSEPLGSPRLWPGGTIYYRFFDSSVESAHSAEVNFAINTWTAAVPCINFVQLPNNNNPGGANGIVTVVAHSTNLGYCAASVGYAPNALWLEMDASGCGSSTIIHEFGHLLSMYHEHQRPDRDSFVQFHCENVIPPTCCGGPACCGMQCQFTIDPGHFPSPQYDIESVMHYPSWAFASSGSTLTDLNGNVLPNAFISLSALDISHIRSLYNCPDVTPPKCNSPCNPHPGQNKCSIPSAQTCVAPSSTVANPRLACACAAGFKATKPGIEDGDTTKQWRLPAPEGNFRVWVAEGVACETPCNSQSGASICQEVTQLPADCLHL